MWSFQQFIDTNVKLQQSLIGLEQYGNISNPFNNNNKKQKNKKKKRKAHQDSDWPKKLVYGCRQGRCFQLCKHQGGEENIERIEKNYAGHRVRCQGRKKLSTPGTKPRVSLRNSAFHPQSFANFRF